MWFKCELFLLVFFFLGYFVCLQSFSHKFVHGFKIILILHIFNILKKFLFFSVFSFTRICIFLILSILYVSGCLCGHYESKIYINISGKMLAKFVNVRFAQKWAMGIQLFACLKC